MRIEKATPLGFCSGVRRAIKLAEKAAQEGEIACLGDIVHNRQVVARLEGLGVRTVASLDEVVGGRVCIPSHGVGPQVLEEARARGLRLLDATCPIVRQAQVVAQKLARDGLTVVIFGDLDHAEVRAVQAWAGEGAQVAPSAEAWLSRPARPGRLGILAQTTQSLQAFGAFISQVVAAGGFAELRVFNTICRPTQQRQAAALEVARRVEVMVVVGSRSSANTRRLAQLCAATGVETHHVEQAAEVDPAWFRGRARVGVTAGASTPDEVIEGVSSRISQGGGDGEQVRHLSQSQREQGRSR